MRKVFRQVFRVMYHNRMRRFAVRTQLRDRSGNGQEALDWEVMQMI